MPTFNHGKNAVVLLDNTNLSTTLTDASVSLTADVAETSTFTASSKTYVSGLKDGTATLSGYFESSSPDADAEFLSQLGIQEEIQLSLVMSLKLLMIDQQTLAQLLL